MKNDFLSKLLQVPIDEENVIKFNNPYPVSVVYDNEIVACSINKEIGYAFNAKDMDFIEETKKDSYEKNWQTLPKSDDKIFAFMEVKSVPIFIDAKNLGEYNELSLFILKKDNENNWLIKKINITELFELGMSKMLKL